MKEEIQHDCSDFFSCPDCDFETVYPAGAQRCNKNLGHGSQLSLGIAGAPGRSTNDSDQLARVRIDVSSIPEHGLNTFQGRLVDISSPWSAEREGEFTLMVCFDSRTHRRLVENLYGDLGRQGMVGADCFLTIPSGEQSST